MSDLLTDIETYFTTEGLLGSYTLFKDVSLDLPDNTICIYEYKGQGAFPQIEGADRNIQIVVRSLSPTEAKQQALILYHSLDTDDGIFNLTTDRWCVLSTQQVPYKMKTDLRDRVYYGFNVNITTYGD